MKLKASKREIKGKKVKNVRKQGMLPASVYGPEIGAMNIQVSANDFDKIFAEVGYNNLFELELDDKSLGQVLVKEVQTDPIMDSVRHISLYKVNMSKPINADVPVVLNGESSAVKNNLGLLVTPVQSIEVHCLPKDLPREFAVDISILENVGDSILLESIKLPEGVEFGASMSQEMVLAYIAAPQKEIVEEAPAAEGGEGEAAAGEAAEAGEAEGSAEKAKEE